MGNVFDLRLGGKENLLQFDGRVYGCEGDRVCSLSGVQVVFGAWVRVNQCEYCPRFIDLCSVRGSELRSLRGSGGIERGAVRRREGRRFALAS